MELAKQLRTNRERLGLSQEDAAKAIFVSRQTLSSWENDKTYPDVQSLLLLSELFDSSLDELVIGDLAVMRKAMEEDSKKLKWLIGIMSASFALALVFLVSLSFLWREPSDLGGFTQGNIVGLGAFLLLYVIGMGAAFAYERIKKKHDVVAYREIKAFLEGSTAEEDLHDPHAFSRAHPFGATAIKLLAGAAFGGVIGWALMSVV